MLKTENLQRYTLRLAFSSAGMLHGLMPSIFMKKPVLPSPKFTAPRKQEALHGQLPRPTGMYAARFKALTGRYSMGSCWCARIFSRPSCPAIRMAFLPLPTAQNPCGADSFTLHGRADNIVKVGGRRVDLAEVCDKLKTLSGVCDAVGLCNAARTGRGSDIAALVVGSMRCTSNKGRACQKLCEPYAIPRHIKIVDSIPVLPTGKHDRERIEKFFDRQREVARIQNPEVRRKTIQDSKNSCRCTVPDA